MKCTLWKEMPMKQLFRLTTCMAFAGLVTVGAGPQDSGITVGIHQLGETFDAWLSKGDPSIETICPDYRPGWKRKEAAAASARCHEHVSEVGRAGEGDIEQFDGAYFSATVHRHWHFSNHKLVQIETLYTEPDTAQQIKWLTERYGPITESDVTKYHNSFGAQWGCLSAIWKTADGGAIWAKESMGTGNKVWLTVSFYSRQVVQKALAAPGKPNPY
jgi:hypothetical protein